MILWKILFILKYLNEFKKRDVKFIYKFVEIVVNSEDLSKYDYTITDGKKKGRF